MQRNKDNVDRLVSLSSALLGTVSGGLRQADWYDYYSGWDWASDSCQRAVREGVRQGGGEMAMGLDAWNGPACDWYGWF